MSNLPDTLGGPGLAAVSGLRVDTHLITSSAWHTLVRLVGYSATFVHLANTVLLAGAAIALGSTIARLGHKRWLALTAAAIFAISPFSLSLLLDPLGAESLVGLLLVLALAGDLAESYTLPNVLRIITPIVLCIQNPEFMLVAIVYGIAELSRRRALAAVILISTIMANVVRFFPGAPPWLRVSLAPIDERSFSLTVIAIAAVCFVLAPLAFTVARVVSNPLRIHSSPASRVLAIGFSALLGGLLLPIDPAVALLGAEACALLALATLSEDWRLVASGLAVAALATVLSFSLVANALPSSVTAQQGADVRRLLGDAGSGSVCIVETAHNDTSVFADGAFLQIYGDGKKVTVHPTVAPCLTQLKSTEAAIAVIGDDKVVRSWSRGSLPLIQAAVALDQSEDALPVSAARAIPNTSNQQAFTRLVAVPQGSVYAFTLAAGYAFEFPCLPVREGDVLTFAASDPFADIPRAQPVRIFVRVNGAERFHVTLSPSERSSTDWTSFRVPLQGGVRCARITFSATAPSGSAVGSWATVAAPALANSRLNGAVDGGSKTERS